MSPRWDIDTNLLKKYFTDGYHRIRKYCQPKDVAVVLPRWLSVIPGIHGIFNRT